jgi:hypothetical protein
MRRRALAAALAVLAAVAPVDGQSLGEAAAKAKQEKAEREKRSKAQPPKSYTNDDLVKHSELGGEAYHPEADPAAPKPRKGLAADSKGKLDEEGREVASGPEAAQGVATGEDRGAQEAHWRDRTRVAQGRASESEAAVQRIETEISNLNAQQLGSTDTYQILALQEQRQAAQQRLQDATRERDEARKDLELLQDEARQQGIPPGWVR